MGPDRLFVSVIMPVYNGEAFLADAIRSVIRQDYGPMEIIVVDDGSTDGTAKVARDFGDTVRYFYKPNGGPPTARNKGLDMSGGDVICFLDADDIWTGNKLEIQLARLESEPSVEVVIGHIQPMRQLTDEEGEPRTEIYHDSWPSLSLGGAVIRKSAFSKVGRFDETLLFNDDVDWFVRAKEKGVAILVHREIVQLCRRHERNLTNQRDLDRRYLIMALKKTLDRRRGDGGGKTGG